MEKGLEADIILCKRRNLKTHKALLPFAFERHCHHIWDDPGLRESDNMLAAAARGDRGSPRLRRRAALGVKVCVE